MISVVSVTHVSEDQYSVTFSRTVTPTNVEDVDPQVLVWSPSAGFWDNVGWVNLTPSATQLFVAASGEEDCTLLMIAGQPLYLTSDEEFMIVGPQSPIS